jgi:hypothetical protein
MLTCDTMRPVRPKPLLLSAAAACAVVHAVGILFAYPLWRYAEVLSVGVLLVYAVVSGLPAPRWAVPAALAGLAMDAVRTMPASKPASLPLGHCWPQPRSYWWCGVAAAGDEVRWPPRRYQLC